MAMTSSEKILAHAAGLQEVHAGQLIMVDLDIVLGNDITGPIAIEEFRKFKTNKVFDKDKVVLVPDHFTPNKDIKAAMQCKFVREFAHSMKLSNYFEVGEAGIEHALLPEKGLVTAGDVVIGADSHTCTYGALGAFSTGVGQTDLGAGMATGKAWFKVPSTIKFNLHGKMKEFITGKDLILHIIGMIGVDGALYKTMEYQGDGVSSLTMDDRFTISNMAIEAGGKNGIFPVDEKTLEYLEKAGAKEPKIYSSDPDACYEKVYDIDLADLENTISFPHLPGNTHIVKDCQGIRIDQVVIGSCTNGRISDLRNAARILEGHHIAKGIRCIIIPATPKIYKEALKEGLIDIFLDSGCVISPPTCGPCLGGYMGILAEGERCVSTTNRNFVGRMGHIKSEIYLASPIVAAACAITGKITDPASIA